MNDSTWVDKSGSPCEEEKMRSPQNIPGPEEDDSSSESCNGVFPMLNPSTTLSTSARDGSLTDINGNSTSSVLELNTTNDDQPINLSDKVRPSLGVPPYTSDVCTGEALRTRGKYALKATSESPPYSSGSYDSIKTEVSGCAEDLTLGRTPAGDDDDDDDHEDNDRITDSEGLDPERLKAFNMFVRLFVDENLDRMVPISKQPKEKIQAIIESCSRQFPEFQERARKRIRTYLKSCRRMKKNGMEMEEISSEKPSGMAQSNYSLPSGTYNQEPVFMNGSLHYSYRGLGPPASGNHSNGPTDLSMKALASGSTNSTATNRAMPCTQLSPTEIGAVRQLIAGYRESAAFLLRSADELENLILQQN
ncbi:hypothetical protein GDO86_014640 [Hymenochirus boettgeri]|uniref:Nucleolar protein 4 helical domain-containing protein n=1 Tax=Hymenochirus boettgeri TaxID=247094 RepID=A0A8T2JPW6_9PIPI|nr:hypothetical protein GDO86_014640 [Hymenochirus boettgeri]